MSSRGYTLIGLATLGLAACATSSERGTLAELAAIEPDVKEVYLADSLDRAAESYRRYLAETPESARTPEAMRRLADLQIEQAYGVIGTGEIVEMAAPQAAPLPDAMPDRVSSGPAQPGESDEEFERRASSRQQLLSANPADTTLLPGTENGTVTGGPLEAIATYREILEKYPNYERNDKVLYQMSRAYDEIGQPDEAMAVMDRLVARYPYSAYVDEVHFRRGEYYFVRKQYLDAEDAYGAIVDIGSTSSYYELALYKLGWTLYKQEFYEEALHHYMAMLDHRQSIGFDFDTEYEEQDELRIADTFRVISLSFSNLGGPEVVDEYFAENGRRRYADKIYGNLGEFYFSKLRYDDAASIYRAYVRLEPFHKVAPHFSMRVVEIFAEANFPLLVVEAKKDFATRYALDSQYWNYHATADNPEVVVFLKTNLTDLAGHYHALYQDADQGREDKRPEFFAEAQRWYRQFLASFPVDTKSPQINYRLADLLLEDGDFAAAAREYEQTAYEYTAHEQAAAAGYAAIYAHRQDLNGATGARQLEAKRDTVASSLRFAETFQGHEQAPAILGAAADDLYDMQEFDAAIAAARTLIERYPDAGTALLRSAWAAIANSSIDLAEYAQAEFAYTNLLELIPEGDDSRPAVVDGLAASIYKQGEQANMLEDYRAAAAHFLRIKDLAPGSEIRTGAEYDAAAALMKLEDWASASSVLEEFRRSHPEHDLGTEATKQLALIYRNDGQTERSAAEHERIAAEADDPELGREALLSAAELYDEVHATADAIRVYEQYVTEHPRPLDVAMETRARLAEIFDTGEDRERYRQELENIVNADRDAGDERTDRSRYLAARAALELAEQSFIQFAELELVQPFEESLAEKQRRMDSTLDVFERLVDYEVAEVTSAATFYIAEIYMEFSTALVESERPAGLTEAEKVDYELVIEEEAYPFEEQAIDLHQKNFELLAGGIFNPWVQKSLDKLAILMPGRYAKNEISGGFLGSIDTYAYRTPTAPIPGIDSDNNVEADSETDDSEAAEATAQVSRTAASRE